MIVLTAFALWVLSWAPNDFLLLARIEAADPLERRLVPWRAVFDPARPLWLVLQEHPLPAPALFVAGADWRPELALWLAGGERSLPELRVPRILLSAQHYQKAAAGFSPLEDLAPDSVERLLHSLFEARWANLLARPAFAAEVEARAEASMAPVPAAFRRQAFLSAVSDFGAHVLSIGHEIGRHQRRRAGRGGLCAVLDHPATLFGSWRRAIEAGEYRGYLPRQRPETPGDSSIRPGTDWVMTSTALRPSDKQWLFDQLGVSWSGDPRLDFRFLCHQDERRDD